MSLYHELPRKGESATLKPMPQPGPTCPRDGTPMAQQQVGEVVLDYCPNCMGIFFDGGEL